MNYLSYFTSAKYWNIPNTSSLLGGAASDKPHISFLNANSRYTSNKHIAHYSKLALPKGSILTDGKLLVASPELTFLQMGECLNTQKLILFGLQMCGHQVGSQGAAVSTKHKIEKFLEQMKGHRGYRNAMRAARYITDGSASIMESLAYMVLTLPSGWGGYGLRGAVFNHEIELTRSMASSLGQRRCFADLYYKKEKVAVEYQSLTYHASAEAQGKDSLRAAALESMGIDVTQITTIQLYDKTALRVFATNLAARLGRRLQLQSKRFPEMHENLRALFPRRE
jgi:hypothetical protein